MKWMWMHGIMNNELWMEMCDKTEIYENCDGNERNENAYHDDLREFKWNVWKGNAMNVHARHCELWEINEYVWKLWWKWNEYECLILYFMTKNEKSVRMQNVCIWNLKWMRENMCVQQDGKYKINVKYMSKEIKWAE